MRTFAGPEADGWSDEWSTNCYGASAAATAGADNGQGVLICGLCAMAFAMPAPREDSPPAWLQLIPEPHVPRAMARPAEARRWRWSPLYGRRG